MRKCRNGASLGQGALNYGAAHSAEKAAPKKLASLPSRARQRYRERRQRTETVKQANGSVAAARRFPNPCKSNESSGPPKSSVQGRQTWRAALETGPRAPSARHQKLPPPQLLLHQDRIRASSTVSFRCRRFAQGGSGERPLLMVCLYGLLNMLSVGYPVSSSVTPLRSQASSSFSPATMIRANRVWGAIFVCPREIRQCAFPTLALT